MPTLDPPVNGTHKNGRLSEARSPRVTPGSAAPTAPCVPQDAPFTGPQRDWLNGFLSGLTVITRAANGTTATATATAEPDATAAPLTVLFGSQSGNCEALSKQLRNTARNQGFAPRVQPLDSFDFSQLPQTKHLVIICSTFGEGDPPDNAKKFTARLLADDAPKLPSLHYSVCALGDRSYTHFCKTGIDLDNRLAELGATRLADRVDCDAAFEDDFAAWQTAVFASKALADIAGASTSTAEEETEHESKASGGGGQRFDKKHPYFAPVHQVHNLSGEGSAKEVNHVEILLAGSGLEYEVGDALGLWPVNDPAIVEEILVATGITGTSRVLLKGDPCPIRLALQTRLDIVTLTQGTLDALEIDATLDKVKGLHLIDALRNHQPEVSAQRLADALRPLQPRLYSIASSPKAHPGEVHLTVSAVRYQLHNSPRKGVASTYLADRCGFGQRVGVYIHKAPHFHLTDNDAAPVIMCGPGTGIAPFRAFLEERQARHAPGKNWLFFGDQHEACDFLYRDQLAAMQADGTLDRLSLAWSRDGKAKVYVQDKMREASFELFSWLEAGAHFYICGDAARMAGDVDTALRDIIKTHGNLDDAGVQDYMDRLVEQHRYQRDVY